MRGPPVRAVPLAASQEETIMSPEVRWMFAIDDQGRARAFDERVKVETVAPGEYLVTLPTPIAADAGIDAWVGDDAGFLAATPGDDAGNKPNVVRVITMTTDNHFGPRPFTIVVRAA
jgi:hypothetical protein